MVSTFVVVKTADAQSPQTRGLFLELEPIEMEAGVVLNISFFRGRKTIIFSYFLVTTTEMINESPKATEHSPEKVERHF